MEAGNTIFGSLPAKGNALDEEKVHHLRKGTKQLRARLQLLRQLEGQREETERLRDSVKQLARLLATQRDADVMQNHLAEFIDQCTDPEMEELLTELRDNLEGQNLPHTDIDRIRHLVSYIEKNTHKLKKHKYPEEEIEKILEQRLALLCTEGTSLLQSVDWPALHEWRKGVKKLMYQYGLKSSQTPKDLYVYEHLDQLGSSLGKINDMTILENYVREQESLNTRAHTLELFEKIYTLIDNERLAMLEESRRIFNEISHLQ